MRMKELYVKDVEVEFNHLQWTDKFRFAKEISHPTFMMILFIETLRP